MRSIGLQTENTMRRLSRHKTARMIGSSRDRFAPDLTIRIPVRSVALVRSPVWHSSWPGSWCQFSPQNCLEISNQINALTVQWDDFRRQHDASLADFLGEVASGGYKEALSEYFDVASEEIGNDLLLGFFDDVIDFAEIAEMNKVKTQLLADYSQYFALGGADSDWDCVQYTDPDGYGYCDWNFILTIAAKPWIYQS